MWTRLAQLGLVIAVAATAGCNDNNDAQDFAVGSDLSAAASDLATGGDLAAGTARVRVAHLSPNAPPIDVCVAARGSTSFMGPVLKAAGVAATGLAYSQVTKYLDLPAGTYDVRVVAGAATSCATGLFESTTLPALGAGASYTVAGIGFFGGDLGANQFALRAYVDTAAADPANVKLRFVHASPDTPPVTVGLGSGAAFMPVFTNVSYPNAGTSTTPASDANGFITIPPPGAPPVISARLVGMNTDALTITLPVAPPAGTIASAFAIGTSSGASSNALKVLACVDNAPATSALATCFVLP